MYTYKISQRWMTECGWVIERQKKKKKKKESLFSCTLFLLLSRKQVNAFFPSKKRNSPTPPTLHYSHSCAIVLVLLSYLAFSPRSYTWAKIEKKNISPTRDFLTTVHLRERYTCKEEKSLTRPWENSEVDNSFVFFEGGRGGERERIRN